MLLLSVILSICVAVSQVVHSIPVEKERIDPVDLKYQCIHVKQEGKDSNKSPILLVHGLTASHKVWDGLYQVLSLRTKRRVCSVDLRNHGDSPWNNRSDIEAMARDIENFLDKKLIKKVNIIGHSLGGKIAVHFTLNNPKRVDSLVVEDMRPNGFTEPAFKIVYAFVKFLKEAIKHVPAGVSEEEAKKTLVGILQNRINQLGINETINQNTARIITIRQVAGKWQWKTNMGLLFQALERYEEFMTPSRGLYKGPTLFIYGTASPFDLAGDKDNILKLFPNAKLIPVVGAGHNIHGNFREFEDAVIKLLNEI